MPNNFALDYIDVATRIVEFRTKHPEGSLQQVSVDFRDFGGKSWVIFTAAAYRSPDDQRPGMGTAWEQVPGSTNFTRDSELQNAETAAWGRAIVAALVTDTKRGIASAEEVRNRRQPQEEEPPENPVTAARLRVKSAWEKTHSDFDPGEVAAGYEQWAASPFDEASPEQLYGYAEYLTQTDDGAAQAADSQPDPASSSLTPKQVTALSIALADIGCGEHEAGLDYIEQTIGRRPESRKHLAPDEFRKVMDAAKFKKRAAVGGGQ